MDSRLGIDKLYLGFRLTAISEYIEKLRDRQERYRREYEEKKRSIGNLSESNLNIEINYNLPDDDDSGIDYNAFQQLEVPFQEEYLQLLRDEKARRQQQVQGTPDNERKQLNEANPLSFQGKDVPLGTMKTFFEGYMNRLSTSGAFKKWQASNYSVKVGGTSYQFYDIGTPCSLWDEETSNSQAFRANVASYIQKTIPTKDGTVASTVNEALQSIKERMDEELSKYEPSSQGHQKLLNEFWETIITASPSPTEEDVKAKIKGFMNVENIQLDAENIRRVYQRACKATILHHLFAVKEQVLTLNRKTNAGTTINNSTVKMIAKMLGRVLTDTCRMLANAKYLPANEE